MKINILIEKLKKLEKDYWNLEIFFSEFNKKAKLNKIECEFAGWNKKYFLIKKNENTGNNK